jgi:hypothetical protein
MDLFDAKTGAQPPFQKKKIMHMKSHAWDNGISQDGASFYFLVEIGNYMS